MAAFSFFSLNDPEKGLKSIQKIELNSNQLTKFSKGPVLTPINTILTRINTIRTRINTILTRINAVFTRINLCLTRNNPVFTRNNPVFTRINSVSTRINRDHVRQQRGHHDGRELPERSRVPTPPPHCNRTANPNPNAASQESSISSLANWQKQRVASTT